MTAQVLISPEPGTPYTNVWIWRLVGSEYQVIDGDSGDWVAVAHATAAPPTLRVLTDAWDEAAPHLTGSPSAPAEVLQEALDYERGRIDSLLSRVRNLAP